MPHHAHDLAEAFRRQAGYCDALGSPLWAHMMRHAARDIDDGGPVGRLLADWEGDLKLGRLGAALLRRRPLPRLVGHGAGAGRSPSVHRRQARRRSLAGSRRCIEANVPLLKRAIASPPQTNEVARSAVLLGGFLRIARRTGMPLRLREVGVQRGPQSRLGPLCL